MEGKIQALEDAHL
uniref:Uncharacterized protein n=1 Tax=Nymphaea colorata TaxID=210225 RepID=A0A5K1D3K8_9MAGN